MASKDKAKRGVRASASNKKRTTGKARPRAKVAKTKRTVTRKPATIAKTKRSLTAKGGVKKPSKRETAAQKLKRLQAELDEHKRKQDRQRKRLKGYKKKGKRRRVHQKPRNPKPTKKPKLPQRVVKEIAPKPKTPAARKTQAEIFREQFDSLLKAAKSQFTKPNYRKQRINSDRALGEKRTVKIGMLVSDKNVLEILHRIEEAAFQMTGMYPIWVCSFHLAAMGEKMLRYGTKLLESKHPNAKNFSIGWDSTGTTHTRVGMLQRASDMVEGWASEKYSMIYVHHVSVTHYGFKRKP